METGIFEIQRFSEITNRTSDTVVTETDSADSINNLGADKVMVYVNGGNDSVKNSGKYVTILRRRRR